MLHVRTLEVGVRYRHDNGSVIEILEHFRDDRFREGVRFRYLIGTEVLKKSEDIDDIDEMYESCRYRQRLMKDRIYNSPLYKAMNG